MSNKLIQEELFRSNTTFYNLCEKENKLDEVRCLQGFIKYLSKSRCKFGGVSDHVEVNNVWFDYKCQNGKPVSGSANRIHCVGGPDECGSVFVTEAKI